MEGTHSGVKNAVEGKCFFCGSTRVEIYCSGTGIYSKKYISRDCCEIYIRRVEVYISKGESGSDGCTARVG